MPASAHAGGGAAPSRASGDSGSSAPRRHRSGPPGEPRAVGWLYVLPGLLIYTAFLLVPLGRAVQISLYDWDGLALGTFVGLQNYVDLVADEELRGAFGHALLLMVFFAVIPVVLGLGLASILNRAKVAGLGFFRTVIFLPQVVAMVVIAVAWRRIYDPANGFPPLRGWLGDYALALPAIGIIGTWFEIGLVTVLLLAGMGRIPGELYEAARLDGAGPIREFFAVTLPSVRGEIAVALTLTVIAALKTFDLIYMTTQGGPGTTTLVPSYAVYDRAFQTAQVGSAAAIGVTLTALIFVITFVINQIGDRSTA